MLSFPCNHESLNRLQWAIAFQGRPGTTSLNPFACGSRLCKTRVTSPGLVLWIGWANIALEIFGFALSTLYCFYILPFYYGLFLRSALHREAEWS